MESDNNDVDALLHQLAELKKKKAQKVKKLKRLLRKDVALKQQFGGVESSKSDDKNLPSPEAETSRVRNDFVELSCEVKSSNFKQSSRNKTKYSKESVLCIEGTEVNSITRASQSEKQPIQLESPKNNTGQTLKGFAKLLGKNDQISSVSSHRKDLSGGKEKGQLSTQESSRAEFSGNDPISSHFNFKHHLWGNSNHDPGGKRPGTKIQNDDQTVKKSKLNDNTPANLSLPSSSKNCSLKEKTEIEDNKSKTRNFDGNLLPPFSSSTNLRRNLFAAKHADEKFALAKGSSNRAENREISIEKDDGNDDFNFCDDFLFPTQCVPDVTEVANTELKVVHRDQMKADCNNELNHPFKVNDVISEATVKSSTNVALNVCEAVDETEEIADKNIPKYILDFEKVVSEVPPSIYLKRGCGDYH